jgi:SAM-dependent methyltransferase
VVEFLHVCGLGVRDEKSKNMNEKEIISELGKKLGHIEEKTASCEKIVSYVLQMWKHALDNAASGDDSVNIGECCDALPYVPFDVATLGLSLKSGSIALDLGCLGGYGLYDWTRRIRKEGRAIPRMIGVDSDSSSIQIAREMAETWARDLDLTFRVANCEKMDFASESIDFVIARLLIPYVRMEECLGEISRVLKSGGIVLFQLHSFRHYLAACRSHLGEPMQCFYYFRPLCSGAWFRLTGRQPKNRRFSETAVSAGTFVKFCGRFGLQPVWQGGFPRKPLVAFRKSGG